MAKGFKFNNKRYCLTDPVKAYIKHLLILLVGITIVFGFPVLLGYLAVPIFNIETTKGLILMNYYGIGAMVIIASVISYFVISGVLKISKAIVNYKYFEEC